MTATSAISRGALAALLCACSGGGAPLVVPPAPFTDPVVGTGEDAPELVVGVTALAGASGAAFFAVGDVIQVEFRVEKADGTGWRLDQMSSALALVSGPTFNYQRLLPARADVAARAVHLGGGRYRYTFAEPIPAVYAAPYNDTAAFGALENELTGQPLLDGTYTVGLSFAWDYTVDGTAFQAVGEATFDFLLGGGTASIAPRRVTSVENCNRCHVTLQAHEGRHENLTLCLLCHTAGAEDPNDPAVAGGTPSVSIDSRVLFHKLHNGSHLPSVLGIEANPDGSRNYHAPPRPYVVVDGNGQARDFSRVGFPVWPNRTVPTARDFGYSSLTTAEQALEDRTRTGITACFVCHGDPDGAGPVEAPAQGRLVFGQPSMHACGACHDDIDWSSPYNSIAAGGMPPQDDDTQCVECHVGPPGRIEVEQAHLHPLRDPTFNPGLRFELLSALESGDDDGDGTLDPGEKLAVELRILDDSGLDVDPASLDSVRAVLSGPTTNANLVLASDVPTALLSGPQPFVLNLPMRERLEFVGHATAGFGDLFLTARTPHHDVAGARTEVLVRTAISAASTVLEAQALAPANFVDVADASGFARGDVVVVDEGVFGAEEYLEIRFVEGQRLWFASPADPDTTPGLRRDHPAGASVQEVQLEPKTLGVDFFLDPVNGLVLEISEFGDGNAVLVSYTTDFVMPATYPQALNASPDLDETHGKWVGKDVVDGTYRLGLSGHRDVVLSFLLEQTPYRIASAPATLDVLVGSATVVEPFGLIDSGDACNACHQDLQFHDGAERGFDDCLLCHGTAGAEDLPRYVAAGAPATPGTEVGFRTLLHRIHMGNRLPNASALQVVGRGPDPYPDNFSLSSFEDVFFPALPGGPLQCTKCHGEANEAWKQPAARDHPTQQGRPVRSWRAVCIGCHASTAAQAHMDVRTSGSGFESCSICHGPGEDEDVVLVHRAR